MTCTNEAYIDYDETSACECSYGVGVSFCCLHGTENNSTKFSKSCFARYFLFFSAMPDLRFPSFPEEELFLFAFCHRKFRVPQP
jgi:hypothetical protein